MHQMFAHMFSTSYQATFAHWRFSFYTSNLNANAHATIPLLFLSQTFITQAISCWFNSNCFGIWIWNSFSNISYSRKCWNLVEQLMNFEGRSKHNRFPQSYLVAESSIPFNAVVCLELLSTRASLSDLWNHSKTNETKRTFIFEPFRDCVNIVPELWRFARPISILDAWFQ